ncbi:MAG TPA: DUF1573 domain-containing protein [Parafilimonas sp.]|jgi:hypothetical protein
MKKFLVLVFLSGIIALSCNSNDTAAKTPAEVEAILNDSSKYTTVEWADTAIDFGTKKMGDIVNITFLCTNTGKKPLYLYDVHPSCGCTLVDYSKAPIAPGQQGKIEAQFDTKKSHPGEVHKTVFVRYNVSNTSRYLKFSGTIIAADSSQTTNK